MRQKWLFWQKFAKVVSISAKGQKYGYEEGISFAEYHFKTWQDDGPPFPWPRTVSNVREFVEECLKRVRIVFLKEWAQDARERGLNPDYIPIEALMEGLNDGYRTRFTELLNKFIKPK